MSVRTTARETPVETHEVERIYGGLAGVYDRLFDWALRPGRLAAVRRLDLAAGRRVLEVGVGTGLSLASYPDDVELTGIDISEAMLQRARLQAERRPELAVSIRRMDAQTMSLADAAFDHVIVPYVISVVPDPQRVMEEIRRVCRPGGTLVVVNHFVHEGAVMRTLERVSTPLTRRIGFRLDTALEVVSQAPGFELQSVEPVNVFGMWKLAVLTRTGAD